MSGFGREYGLESLYKYLQIKSVVTPIYNSPWLWTCTCFFLKKKKVVGWPTVIWCCGVVVFKLIEIKIDCVCLLNIRRYIWIYVSNPRSVILIPWYLEAKYQIYIIYVSNIWNKKLIRWLSRYKKNLNFIFNRWLK